MLTVQQICECQIELTTLIESWLYNKIESSCEFAENVDYTATNLMSSMAAAATSVLVAATEAQTFLREQEDV